jgi:exonuclease VII small subunit
MTDEELIAQLRKDAAYWSDTDPYQAGRYRQASDRIEALTAEVERLRLKLEQASNNLKAGAKRYECPGLAASARLAFEALEKQP